MTSSKKKLLVLAKTATPAPAPLVLGGSGKLKPKPKLPKPTTVAKSKNVDGVSDINEEDELIPDNGNNEEEPGGEQDEAEAEVNDEDDDDGHRKVTGDQEEEDEEEGATGEDANEPTEEVAAEEDDDDDDDDEPPLPLARIKNVSVSSVAAIGVKKGANGKSASAAEAGVGAKRKLLTIPTGKPSNASTTKRQVPITTLPPKKKLKRLDGGTSGSDPSPTHASSSASAGTVASKRKKTPKEVTPTLKKKGVARTEAREEDKTEEDTTFKAWILKHKQREALNKKIDKMPMTPSLLRVLNDMTEDLIRQFCSEMQKFLEGHIRVDAITYREVKSTCVFVLHRVMSDRSLRDAAEEAIDIAMSKLKEQKAPANGSAVRERAGLIFPPRRVFKRLKSHFAQVTISAGIAMAAVLDEVIGWVMESIIDTAVTNNATELTKRHCALACSDDTLKKIFPPGSISGAGVLPHIELALLPKDLRDAAKRQLIMQARRLKAES